MGASARLVVDPSFEWPREHDLVSSSVQVLLLIPVITGIIGLVTNWAAVQMIFRPRRFIGFGRIGWQGVVPARNDQFAREVAESVG